MCCIFASHPKTVPGRTLSMAGDGDPIEAVKSSSGSCLSVSGRRRVEKSSFGTSSPCGLVLSLALASSYPRCIVICCNINIVAVRVIRIQEVILLRQSTLIRSQTTFCGFVRRTQPPKLDIAARTICAHTGTTTSRWVCPVISVLVCALLTNRTGRPARAARFRQARSCRKAVRARYPALQLP